MTKMLPSSFSVFDTDFRGTSYSQQNQTDSSTIMLVTTTCRRFHLKFTISNCLPNATELSPSWEATSRSAIQEFSNIL
jgi:hypothetical protein